MSRRIRKPGILAMAHREHRCQTGAMVAGTLARDAVIWHRDRGRGRYLTGPRAGQELADARRWYDAHTLPGWRRP